MRGQVFRDQHQFHQRHSEMQSSQNGSQLSKDTLTNKALPLRFGSALPEKSEKESTVLSPTFNREF